MLKPLWLTPLIAHNSNLIKNRNLNTYTNTQEGTLYPVGFAFMLVCFFLAPHNAHVGDATAPSSGGLKEHNSDVHLLVCEMNYKVYFNNSKYVLNFTGTTTWKYSFIIFFAKKGFDHTVEA